VNNLETLLSTYVAETQELETAMQEVLSDRWIDSSVGVQLDGLGRIVGRDRAGNSDNTYRGLIKAQIAINAGTSIVQDIVSILELILPSVTIKLVQEYPATFSVYLLQDVILESTASLVADAINQSRAGGVRAFLNYQIASPQFKLDGAGGAVFDGAFYLIATIDCRG